MFNSRNDLRFKEQPRVQSGQYSIKVEYCMEIKDEFGDTEKHWKAIGYISKRYSKEENRNIFSATDAMGNPVFSDTKELHVLKQQFKNNGKQLAEAAQMVEKNRINQALRNQKTQTHQSVQRSTDLKNLRDKNKDKLKRKEIQQGQKVKNLRTERELDAKNEEKHKEVELDKADTLSNEHHNTAIEAENSNQQEQDNVAERMDELEIMRDDEQDIEQDLDMDM